MKYLIFCVIVFVFSCKTNSILQPANKIIQYKLINIETNQALDLNNDGIKSKDIIDEIEFYNFQGTKNKYLELESPNYYLEIRVLPSNSIDLDIQFPHQVVSKPPERIDLLFYISSMYNYTYSSTNSKIIDNVPKVNHEFGTVDSINFADNSLIKIKLTKTFYDFSDKKWTQAEIVASYSLI